MGEYASYPGDWLYHTWSESELKEFLDERGIPVPQPTTRDRLIAYVRRNARLASLSLRASASSASKSAASAQASLIDALLDAWTESQLKEFLDKYGVPVPQGSRKNELVALARKHRAYLSGGSAASSISSESPTSAFGAATSSAGNEYAKATDDPSLAADDAFHKAIDAWSESRLKAFLDARGVPVPHASTKDELIAQVRLHKHQAATSWSPWTFDTWTVDNLKNYLATLGKKTKNAGASRDELVKQVQDAYVSASKAGGSIYASVTNYLSRQTDAAKEAAFDRWSDSDLKDYLDSYGISTGQESASNQLRAEAKKHADYFRYGTTTPSDTILERIKSGFQSVLAQIQGIVSSVASRASPSGTSVASRAAQSTASVKQEL